MLRWLKQLLGLSPKLTKEQDLALLQQQSDILKGPLSRSDPEFVRKLDEINQLESPEEQMKALKELENLPLPSDD